MTDTTASRGPRQASPRRDFWLPPLLGTLAELLPTSPQPRLAALHLPLRLPRLGWPRWAATLRSDDGMSTAEYAIGTIAAAAFAAILYTVVTGDSVVSGLTELVQRALSSDL